MGASPTSLTALPASRWSSWWLLSFASPVLLLLACLCRHRLRRWLRVMAAARSLRPILPTVPLLGNAHLCLRGLKHIPNSLVRALKKSSSLGINTESFWIGPYPIFIVRNSDDIQTVMTKSQTAEKSREYGFLNFALGNGLLIAPGVVHKVTRRHINPLFQQRNLQQLLPVFNSTSRHLVRSLSKHVGDPSVNLVEPVGVCAFLNICGVIFGADMETDVASTEYLNVMSITYSISRIMMHRFYKIWLWPDFLFQFLWRNEIKNIHEGWQKFVSAVTKKKLLRSTSNAEKDVQLLQADDQHVSKENEESKTMTLTDVYENLEQNHCEFSSMDLQFEMLTLVFTGSDSAKIAISSCLLSLAACPDIQEKLYREIVSVAGAEDTDLSLESLGSMPYLDQVFKETLRKYNVVPFIFRKVNQDIALRGECTVPAGATVGVDLLGMHFNPRAFPQPEIFDPDRFHPRHSAKLKKQWLPFSGGSRNCIGSLYACWLFKTVVVHVLRRYRLTTRVDTSDVTFKGTVVLSREGGYPVELQERAFYAG